MLTRHIVWLSVIIAVVWLIFFMAFKTINKSSELLEEISTQKQNTDYCIYKLLETVNNCERDLRLLQEIDIASNQQKKDTYLEYLDDYNDAKKNLLQVSVHWNLKAKNLLYSTFDLVENSIFRKQNFETNTIVIQPPEKFHIKKFNQSINSLMEAIIEGKTNSEVMFHKTTNKYLSIMYALGVIILLLSILYIFHLHNTIIKPISDINKYVRDFSFRSNSKIPEISGNDEIQELNTNIRNKFNYLKSRYNVLYENNWNLQNRGKLQYSYMRKIEAQREALWRENESKTKLLSVISHDLKGPFSILLNLPKKLYENFDEISDSEKKHLAKTTFAEARQTYHLLEQLLLWVKLQKGIVENMPTYTILKDLINSCLSHFENQMKEKNIDAKNMVDDETDIIVDANILETILRNLISNAIKFTPGGGNVSIYTQKGENSISISVSDTGIGMNKEQQKKLFNAGKNFTRKGTFDEIGHGLGFQISKDLAAILHATIKIESEINKGSTFTIEIPYGKQKPTKKVYDKTIDNFTENMNEYEKEKMLNNVIAQEKVLENIYSKLKEDMRIPFVKIFAKQIIKAGQILGLSDFSMIGARLFAAAQQYNDTEILNEMENYKKMIANIKKHLRS